MEKFFLRCAMLDDYCAAAELVASAEHESAVVGCGVVVVVVVVVAGAAGGERVAVTHQKEHHLPMST